MGQRGLLRSCCIPSCSALLHASGCSVCVHSKLAARPTSRVNPPAAADTSKTSPGLELRVLSQGEQAISATMSQRVRPRGAACLALLAALVLCSRDPPSAGC